MASQRQLKSRIRSVRSTKQITKAMQLVAASKMRKTQDATKASTPYAMAAREILANLSTQLETARHPLYHQRKVRTRLLIVVAGDRGLAGAYNSNIFKRYITERTEDQSHNIKHKTIAVGHRTLQFVSRLKDTDVVGAYEYLPDYPTGRELHTMFDTAKEMFLSGEVDAVDVIYTRFVSSMIQEPTVERLLPAGASVDASEPDDTTVKRDVLYEPDAETVLDATASRLVSAELFQALLDARASEYIMKMMAMKNATDNATDLIEDLTLAMNKARQGAITQELAEISGGVEAMNN